VIDAAMVDGCAYLGSFLLASRNIGIWTGNWVLDRSKDFVESIYSAHHTLLLAPVSPSHMKL